MPGLNRPAGRDVGVGDAVTKQRREAAVKQPERREITLTPAVSLGLLLAVGLGLVAGYGALVPRGQGPDEESHLLCVRTYAGQVVSEAGWAWGLPVFATAGEGLNFETHQPPLYYGLASWCYRLGGETAVRGMSLVCYLLLVVVTFRLVAALTGVDLALAAAAFVAWLPMHAFLAWRVNNDGLTNLLWAIALWRWCLALRDGPSVSEGWRSGLAVGAALLCKQSSLGLLPLALLAGVLVGANTTQWRRAAVQTAVCLGLALLLAGWWYARNVVLYGDLLAQTAFDARFLAVRTTRESLSTMMASRPDFHYWRYVWAWAVRSSVIYLGHDLFVLPWSVYQLHGPLLLVSGTLGGAGFAKLALRRPRDPRTGAGWLLGAGLLLSLVMLAKFNAVYFQAQGRYLFIMLPAWGLLLAGGASRLFPPGSRLRRYALWVLPGWLALLNLLFLTVYVPGLFEAP